MSWQEAGHFQFREDNFAWTLPGGEAFCRHSETYRMIAKLNSFLCAPDQVQASEVLDYLPQPNSCRWIRDRTNHITSSTEPLEVLISQAALACGDSSVFFDLATSHAKAAVARHLMPQKVMHAQAALGSAMTKGERAGGDSTRRPREEALAVLDVALGSTKKMRLRKYAELIKEITEQYK